MQEPSKSLASEKAEAAERPNRPDPRGIPVENEVVAPPPKKDRPNKQDLASILEASSGWSDLQTEKPKTLSKPLELKVPIQKELDEDVPTASENANRNALSHNKAHDREEIQDEDLLELTIERFKERLQSGRWTCMQLTEAYIHRIQRLDKKIHAVLEINPDAVALAKQLDDNFDELGSLPLYGVPILLKDNIDTADRMTTSAGSLALKGRRAKQDSFAAAKLREAGAILLGKVNMTEWANYMSDRMPSGYSSRGGQTRNPYDDYPVGGSSSGSAAAVSANFALGALGSETSGSIVDPSAYQSVVGIKPTVGLISRSGVIPLSLTQDTLGPIARTVLDAALILEAMAFGDEADACTLLPQRPISFLPGRGEDDLPMRLKVGIVRQAVAEMDEETQAVFQQAIAGLQEAGIQVVENVDLPSYNDEWDGTVLRREFKTAIDTFFAAQDPETSPANLKELIAFNENNRSACLKYGQSLLEEAEQSGGSLEDDEYRGSKESGVRRAGAEGIDLALQKYDIHALAFVDSAGSDLAARAGYPLVSVPAGYTSSGRPVGLLLSGTAMSDPLLIEIAYRFEKATQRRKIPQSGLA
ncbi:amidase family protein [Saccharibacillus sp. JS10]|uniref:amidase family protein n=1 Tax=Saccharibacillus sp. JS10 TaxID=2950552 RepID=UPI00210B0CAF|nr:amidase family protein [Saccharibacillus sp. JS10]MCQ4088647.1 amidase family protein [Saccharibacillus sp. JS10]